MMVEYGKDVIHVHNRSKSTGFLELKFTDQCIHNEMWGKTFH
jgi:hypothetical protein